MHVPGNARFVVDFDASIDFTDMGPSYTGPPMHTFAVFANPVLPVPDPASDPAVVVVKAGDAFPPSLLAGSTLVFASEPGMHKAPPSTDGWQEWAVPSDMRIFLQMGTVVHSGVINLGGWGKDNITIGGYGMLTGDQDRCSTLFNSMKCCANNSPKGIELRHALQQHHWHHAHGFSLAPYHRAGHVMHAVAV